MREQPVVLHQGVFKPTAKTSEAVFMITGMTIGAGVLGIPYVVAQVGLLPGLGFILVLGLVMLALNLLIGEITVRTGESLQLPGLAGKYLGGWAKSLMSLIIVLSGYGALLAYIVGESETLSALFGGDALWWGVFFWSLGSFLVWRGLQTVKKVEKIFSILVIGLITILSVYLLRHFQPEVVPYYNLSKMFLPYGVILFALHASPAIAEAHALLPGSQRHFRRAVILGTLIPIAVYMLFALAAVGAGGLSVTEVATVGLGQKFGDGVALLGNLFAIFAMGTGFFGFGVALKQTFVWDHKLSPWFSQFLVISIPLALFLLGLRSFIGILDLVGGLFIGVEAIIVALVFWRARQRGDLDASRYTLPHVWLLLAPVLLVFTLATVFSIIKLIN